MHALSRSSANGEKQEQRYKSTIRHINWFRWLFVIILVVFFSPEAGHVSGPDGRLGMLVAGEFLLGLPWGVFQAAVLPYASEIAPAKLRPTLTTFVNMCWLFGQLLSTAAIKMVEGEEGSLVEEDGARCVRTGVMEEEEEYKWGLKAFRLPVAVQ